MYFDITGGVDYNSGPYTVTFPNGSTTASFNITIVNDNVVEFDEVFTVSVVNSRIAGTPAVATVTIIDTTSKYIHKIRVSYMYLHTYVCIAT